MAIFNSKLFNYQTLELLHISPPFLQQLSNPLRSCNMRCKRWGACWSSIPPQYHRAGALRDGEDGRMGSGVQCVQLSYGAWLKSIHHFSDGMRPQSPCGKSSSPKPIWFPYWNPRWLAGNSPWRRFCWQNRCFTTWGFFPATELITGG